ncbi:MAG: enoyl-CoA hydratase [Betaproteobacteria bacterium HGW-Betaproteobacteria-12]|nr:MAG: enoyl-CoA hydratase [Betaproteobacteria bacterium HGW-Betaproteobacteria-12]
MPVYTSLALSLDQGIAEIRLNRPDKSNAINDAMWREIRQACEWADATPAVRVVILSGAGKNFCAGIDLAMLGSIRQRVAAPEPAQRRAALRDIIGDLQDCLTALERCRKPVLAAIHGACVGGALDLVSACDMRYASADAVFSIKEIDLAMVADVGTLQRLPHLIGQGLTRELAYTGRNVDAEEALRLGLINRHFATAEELMVGVREIAAAIASKSPQAIRGIKQVLNHSRDRSIDDGLAFVAEWNADHLLSADLDEAIAAQRERRAPRFAD